MRDIVLFLIAVLVIFLIEKEYKIRKLFLYPSLLLYSFFPVVAFAGIIAIKKSIKKADSKRIKFGKECGITCLFVLMIIFGSSRSVDGNFLLITNAIFHFTLQSAISLFLIVISFFLYYRIAKILFGESKKSWVFYLLFVLLLYVFGYQSFEAKDTIFLFDCISMTLIIKQVIVPLILLVVLIKGTDKPLMVELAIEEEEKDTMGKFINVKTLALVIVIYALLSVFSIYKLNTKINNMSIYMQNMQESIDELKGTENTDAVSEEEIEAE